MDQLSKLLNDIGVTDIYFCSGARNKILHPYLKEFTLHYEFEERSASFKALGQAKMSKRPVVICTTSGSASLECLPALAEAYYTGTKLILITADRSKSHSGTGFAQTLDQLSPFHSLVRSQQEIFKDDKGQVVINEYPAHINIYTENEHAQYKEQSTIEEVPSIFIFSEGATSVCGNETYQHIAQRCIHYLEPDCDIKSENSSLEVHSDEQLCSIMKNEDIKQVIRVGRGPISKVWRNLNDGRYPSIKLFHLDPDGLKRIPYGDLLESAKDILAIDFPGADKVECFEEKLKALLEKYPRAECSLIARSIPKDALIFLGNSLTIRNWKTISKRTTGIFSNRGINGIDGSLSTAAGLAAGVDEELYCIVGDLTFLYDLNALTSPLPTNLKIVVVNNGGGRIFEAITPPFPEIVCSHDKKILDVIKGLNLPEGQVIELLPNNKQTISFREEWRKIHE